jgi:L-aspartate oxidase
LRLPTGESRSVADSDPVARVRDVLWDKVGIVRSGRGLRAAVRELEGIERGAEPADADAFPGTAANAALTASLIAHAALAREESRGAHFRSDFPRSSARWRLHLGFRRAGARA